MASPRRTATTKPTGAGRSGGKSGSAVYVPDAGHLIWLNFDPQAGREQAGRRPALVLSPARYNAASGLALVCPVTSRVKGYPFEIALPEGLPLSGVVLSDHLKSADWRERRAAYVGRVDMSVMIEIRARLSPLLGFS